jgi:acetolactate decarboxylase
VPHDAQLIASLTIRAERLDEVADVDEADHVALQAASLHSLLDGNYDGDLTIGELLAHGDHGIGTLNGLDGELIILDGEAWQARADGTVVRVAPGEKTPFAVVTKLSDAETFSVDEPLNNDSLLDLIDEHLPAGERNAVVRIDGHFSRIHARSVPKQTPPYRSLIEVADDMVEWTWENLNATIVGFRFDSSADSLEIVGHHMHVISDDRAHSGHVLGCDLQWGSVKVESIEELHCELPPGVDLLPGHGQIDAGALRSIEEE